MYLKMGPQTGQIMTLANSIIGVGILAIPFCFEKCGIFLSILLLLISNFITKVACHYMIKASILTRRRNFEFLAFHAFGFSGKLLVELCIIGYLMGTCIAYFVVLGDIGPQIIAKMFHLTNSYTLRFWVMVIVTIICVIPLGLLRNVDSLSAVCTASIGFYCCLVLKVMAESSTHITTGDWLTKVDFWKPTGVLQCLPIFSMALSCQMQIFEVYETMQTASLEKMNAIVRSATNICTIVYIFVGFFGYVAFCTQNFSGNILLNFSPSLMSDIIKIGFVISVAFSFPLVIFPCRASLYSLLYRRNHSDAANYIPEVKFKSITIVLVLLGLLLGLLIPSIELVIGIVGSTIGVAICIMFPSLCFIKISKKESNEKLLAQFMLFFGFTLMILGTYANLNAIDEKKSGNSAINVALVDNKEIVNPTRIPIKLNENLDHKINEKIEIEKVKIFEPQKIIDNIEIETPPPLVNKNEEQLIKSNQVESQDINNKKEEIDPNALQKEDHEIEIDEKQKKKIEDENLEKTKELFEEKVNEIKKEFEKQSKDTQKLVNDKLDAIAEKVDQIKKIKDDEEVLDEPKKSKDDNTVKLSDSPVVEILPIVKLNNNNNPVIRLLSEKLVDTKKTEYEIKQPNKTEVEKSVVYEPISYKIGEMINNKNKVIVQKLIPPLPLVLLNLSNPIVTNTELKINSVEENNKNVISEIKKENVEQVEPKTLASNDKQEENVKLAKEKIKEEIKEEEPNPKKEPIKNESEDGIDSIRRDLLEVITNISDETSSLKPVELEKREKREIDDDNKIKCDLPTKDLNLNTGIGTDIKMVSRDLKSVRDNDM